MQIIFRVRINFHISQFYPVDSENFQILDKIAIYKIRLRQIRIGLAQADQSYTTDDHPRHLVVHKYFTSSQRIQAHFDFYQNNAHTKKIIFEFSRAKKTERAGLVIEHV